MKARVDVADASASAAALCMRKAHLLHIEDMAGSSYRVCWKTSKSINASRMSRRSRRGLAMLGIPGETPQSTSSRATTEGIQYILNQHNLLCRCPQVQYGLLLASSKPCDNAVPNDSDNTAAMRPPAKPSIPPFRCAHHQASGRLKQRSRIVWTAQGGTAPITVILTCKQVSKKASRKSPSIQRPAPPSKPAPTP